MLLWKWTLRPWARRFFVWCRWLHIYLSTTLFGLLLFFAITGILLNHPTWQGNNEDSVTTHPLPEDVREALSGAGPSLDIFTDYVYQLTGLKTPREINFDAEFQEVTLDYPLPAGYVYAVISGENSLLTLEHRRGSILAVLNDLHKGRHSGVIWSWLIDISAILFAGFAITGMAILLHNPKFRSTGLWLATLGAMSPWLIYLLAVPSF